MLPPPVTIPIWIPRSCTSRISSAISAITFSSTPCPALPARISPLSLSRIRWNAAAKPLLLAEVESDEAADDDVLSGLGRGLGDQLLNGHLVVLDERLLEQAHLGVELRNLAVYDLLDDVGRLPRGLELSAVD